LIKNHPEINTWFIAGHSLGGAMACEYFSKHQEKFSGLILFGSYCAADIRETTKKVVSLSGTLDSFSTTEKIEKYREKLPKSARLVFVEGANHSQMGNYGLQPGDNEPIALESEVSFAITQELEKLLKN
jgi:pimeloyl-ACP methyl ester carboxylesterase